MSDDNPYLNNPLHGVGLKTVLHELVSHYGFDILYAHLNIKCFKTNPSLPASLKFLKKTDWAREKVEVFYLYQYKHLPSVSSEQFKLPPRERIVPDHHVPGEPKVLTIEDGERLQEKRAANTANRNSYTGERKGSSREYNERRSTGLYKSHDERPKSKPSYYKSESDVEDSEPKYYKASKDSNSQNSKTNFYKSDKASESDSYEAGDNSPSKSSYYKTGGDSSDAKPAPAKDPWGNFKGGED